MKNICLCLSFHAPFALKRYRFFEIGQDHYYYDDMQTEEHLSWLVNESYLPLCRTLKEMVQFSHGKFHCAIAIDGITLELFEQYSPEMIDLLRELAATQCVEFLATPFAASLASNFDADEAARQFKQHADLIAELFGQKTASVWNTELLYSDEISEALLKAGYKTVLTEGAKHILSWKSPNYLYQSAVSSRQKLLLRNSALSDELAFHFSDPNWHNHPIDAEKYAQQLSELPAEEQLINIWLGAETFGIRQNAQTGIFDFLKALPFYALERDMCFVTPQEAQKALTPSSPISVPFPMTWAGEAKDLAPFCGNDLQQEAIHKLYAVTERVRLCSDKRLKRDWLMLQDAQHFAYMNHATSDHGHYESSYDAFTNYMNVLADFLQMVDEQYPTTIENEELNALLKTINNQEKEIEELENKLSRKK